MSATHRRRLRFALGMLQMAAASVAFVLLVLTGVSTSALVAAVTACTFTTVSVLLFGSRRGLRRPGASERIR